MKPEYPRLAARVVLFSVPLFLSAFPPDTWKLYVLGPVVILFLAQEMYLILPTPAPLETVRRLDSIVRYALNELQNRYFETISSPPGSIDVRFNIMLPVRKSRFSKSTHLQIFYRSDRSIFGEPEPQNRWAQGEGNCGRAWLSNDQCFFDSVRYPEAAELGQKVRSVGNIKSVISTPIRSLKGQAVGILNFDSKLNLDASRFDTPLVQNLAWQFAAVLAPLVPPNGVALRTKPSTAPEDT